MAAGWTYEIMSGQHPGSVSQVNISIVEQYSSIVQQNSRNLRRIKDAGQVRKMQDYDSAGKKRMTVGPLNIVLPVTLEGSVVRLEPVRREHAESFWNVAKDDLEDIFRWIPYSMKVREDFERLVEKAFQEQERGESVVFATTDRASGRTVGSTRFMNIDRANRRVEIGSTWIAPAWQRTAINTEAKYLMLRQAFEVWGCVRVELKTDALNEKSRNAILRIGAKEEGTLRRHVVTWTGRIRDSVYFSILDDEWPAAKARLEARISLGTPSL
jgi:N-acetyltransferase